jgi:hypothetical protein
MATHQTEAAYHHAVAILRDDFLLPPDVVRTHNLACSGRQLVRFGEQSSIVGRFSNGNVFFGTWEHMIPSPNVGLALARKI